jgi:lipopolysaccharide/colanic/teichoic acid biosynthesis glycosyltransferase
LDLYAVEHQSFILDCRIILKTVGKVFVDASSDGKAIVEPFKGTPEK